jgi:hypothetical protein
MRKTAEEIQALALTLMHAGHPQYAERIFKAHEALRIVSAGDDEEAPSEYKQMEEFLNSNLTAIKKDRQGAWWAPPNNFMINSAIMGLNTWVYRILPMFAAKTAYRPADPERGMPEGLVIDPGWTPSRDDPTGGDTIIHSLKNAELLAKVAKSQPSVTDNVKMEFRWVESKFGVKIPSGVESAILRDTLKVAVRRWGVNRLRTKKILVPFDGSKSQELSNW